MSTYPDSPPGIQTDARFLERIRKSFAHDLRTPLGSIVNYAGILESSREAPALEVRDLAGHIRRNAQRIAAMLGLLARATELASAGPRTATVDLLQLARSVLGEAGGRGSVRLSEATASANADLDAEVLQFALQAYLAATCGSMQTPLVDVEIRISSGHDAIELELCCSAVLSSEETLAPPGEFHEPADFLRHNGGSARTESTLALTLAREVLLSRGGDLLVRGQASSRSALRLRLPGTARARPSGL